MWGAGAETPQAALCDRDNFTISFEIIVHTLVYSTSELGNSSCPRMNLLVIELSFFPVKIAMLFRVNKSYEMQMAPVSQLLTSVRALLSSSVQWRKKVKQKLEKCYSPLGRREIFKI